jgi:hypothetical protein
MPRRAIARAPQKSSASTGVRCIEWLSDLASTSRNNISKNATHRVGIFRALKIGSACPQSNPEEIMRKLTLNATCVALAAAAIAVVGVSTVRAEELMMKKLNVPFSFLVGDVRMPAGEYAIRETSSTGVLEIVSADRKHVALTATIPDAYLPAKEGNIEVVFQKFGGDYFLSRIEPASGNDRQVLLTPSIMEREIIKAERAN